PKDRHLRPILRKESEPFVGRSYPADADEYNTLLACAYKSVSQNWGVARINNGAHPQFLIGVSQGPGAWTLRLAP
ncbi:MAG TPA: hypothetical protein VEH09_02470, partial [Thermodesulfobacteriota bacterium]|nr:hypothetical protein [Thermodesulfobacteriota bacterium]